MSIEIMPRVLQIGLMLVVWAAAMLAALSIYNWPGNWGHAICGPWGCGPPLQALVTCHMAWLVAFGPPTVMIVRSGLLPTHLRRRFATVLCGAAALALVAVFVHQRLTWWPEVSEWQREFYWRRCGFVVVTMVDVPLVEVLLASIYVALCRPKPYDKTIDRNRPFGTLKDLS